MEKQSATRAAQRPVLRSSTATEDGSDASQSSISVQQSAVRVCSRWAIVRPAFTLVELLVVIAVIALAMSITLPGVIGLFTAGSDLQARNVISGTLGAARSVAIENQSYALVHVQLDSDGKCWAVVMEYDN
ncbi:MAG: prepilin-type N-terminal cleavage/methylation domain-containing protein, partial [Phycisphaerae bacterium]|nr:prepilin-type N-terminal cleavage/methylation domain-containing protein [Phycisphaerae bacterium]